MATWDRYKTNVTGFETRALVGSNFTPRFYCDDATTVYTTKAPVAHLKLTPIVQFINTNIAWDVQQSNSATGTIDTFDLTFGGGGATDLTGQDWAVDPLTGNVQYTSTGIYTVTLYVTDTLGNRSQADKQTVFIVTQQGISRGYIATDDKALWIQSGATTTQKAGSLAGTDLQFTSGALNPHFVHLAVGNHHYWAATPVNLVYTVDGGETYSTITPATLGDPTNTAGDGSPPDTDDLDNIAVTFDPKDPRRIYLLRATDSTWNASFDPRVFLYWSDDYGAAWSSVGVGI